MRLTICALLLSSPAFAGGWAEPVFPPEAFEWSCDIPIISERTGEVLYWNRRVECQEPREPEGGNRSPREPEPGYSPEPKPEPEPEPEPCRDGRPQKEI